MLSVLVLIGAIFSEGAPVEGAGSPLCKRVCALAATIQGVGDETLSEFAGGFIVAELVGVLGDADFLGKDSSGKHGQGDRFIHQIFYLCS